MRTADTTRPSPTPPCVNIVDYDRLRLGRSTKTVCRSAWLDEIAQNANVEEGRDPNEPQIIIKRNAPPDDQRRTKSKSQNPKKPAGSMT